MEGKKRLATATGTATSVFLLAVLLLSGQPRQVAAMSEFCRCYKQCYAECRRELGPDPCNFQCLQDCVNDQLPPARPRSAADCNRVCLIRVYGVMSTAALAAAGGGDAEACLVDCHNSVGHSAAQLEVANKLTGPGTTNQ